MKWANVALVENEKNHQTKQEPRRRQTNEHFMKISTPNAICLGLNKNNAVNHLENTYSESEVNCE